MFFAFPKRLCGGGPRRRGRFVRHPAWLASAIVVAFVVLAMLPAPVHAQFDTQAKQAFLIDVETNSVLLERNPDQLMPPSSMAKLATLAVVFEALKRGTLTMQTEMLVSENAWRKGGAPSGTSSMFLPIGAKVTVDQLLQGIIVQSGNDACIVIAEEMAGSEEAFAQLMTQYVRKIGLTKSTFGNSTGLPHPDNLVTARELALLARHIIETYPEYYPMFAQRDFTYGRHKFINRNPLIFLDIGADGLKTGYIQAAGYGIVGSAKSGERRLILVLNGLPSKKARREEGRRILQWGFRAFKRYLLFDGGEVVSEARVWGGAKQYVQVTGEGDMYVVLPVTAQSNLKGALVYQGPLKPPIRKGERIGYLKVSAPNATTNKIPVIAGEDVEEGGIISKGLDSLLFLVFGWLY